MDIEYGKLSKVCQNCGEAFAGSIKVNGKARNTSDRVYCFKCSPFGSNNKIHLSKYEVIDGIKYKLCSRCGEFKPLLSDYYQLSRVAGACKLCTNKIDRDRSQATKIAAVEYKGGKCQDCQQAFHASVYDFHHLDPNEKDFTIGNRRLLKIKTELDKCVLLCANCHRSRHFDQTNPNYCPHV